MTNNEKNIQLETEKRLLNDIKDLKVNISIEDENILRKDREWVELQDKKISLVTNAQKYYEELLSLSNKMGIEFDDVIKYEQNKRKIEDLTKQLGKFGDTQRDAIEKYIKNLQSQNQHYDTYLNNLGLTQIQQDKLFQTVKKHVDTEEELTKVKDKQLLIGDKALIQEKERVKTIDSQISKIKSINDSIQAVGKIGRDIFESGKKILGPWTKVNDAVGVYQRRIGGSRQGMAALEKQILEVATQTARKFGATGDVLLKLQQGYNEEIGRTFTLSERQQGDIAAMNRLMGEGSTIAIATGLERFGVGIDEVGDHITSMFNDTTKKGVVFGKVSKTFADNIKLAQNYTFKRGLDSLREMAVYSTKMRLDMQSVAAFADKVSTPEGAIDTAASLQVLGGSFAQFANPMAMLYEGLNDFEGLGKRMNDMVARLGKWNSQTGEVEFSSFNRQRIKAAAQAMGVDYGSMMENAQTNARRGAIERNLGNRYGNNPELRELILNTAQYDRDNRNWYVTDNQGQKRDINNVDDSIKSALSARSNSTEKNVQDIAIAVRGMSEVFGDIQKGSESYQAKWMAGFGNFTKTLGIGLTGMPEMIKFIATTQLARIIRMLAINTTANLVNIGKNFKGGMRGDNLGRAAKQARPGKPYVTPDGTKYIKTKKGQLLTQRKNPTTGRWQFTGNATKSASGMGKAARVAKLGKIGGAATGGVLSAGAAALKYGSQGAFQKESGRRNEAWGGTIGAGVGGAAGAVIGQALIPIPVVGALIGGYIGQWLGKEVGAAGGKAVDKKRNKYKIDRFESNVENATLNIAHGAYLGNETIEYGKGGLLKGPSHIKGGMSVAGTNITVEGGEFVVNKEATANNLELLKAINKNTSSNTITSSSVENYQHSKVSPIPLSDNTIIKPTEPYGKILKVSENVNGQYYNSRTGHEDIRIKPIDIKLSGSIKLEGGGKNIDMTKEIVDNPLIIGQLTDMITKQININQHGGFKKEEYKQKW